MNDQISIHMREGFADRGRIAQRARVPPSRLREPAGDDNFDNPVLVGRGEHRPTDVNGRRRAKRLSQNELHAALTARIGARAGNCFPDANEFHQK